MQPQVSEDRAILERTPPPANRRIAYGAGQSQFGDLRVPQGSGPFPLAIVIHGGFWRAQYDLLHIGHLCAALTELGIATWSLEYRRVGEPGGGWPGTFDDVLAGTAYAPNLPAKLDFTRVLTIGHSAGGHLALWLATQSLPFALRAALSLAGVSDLVMAAQLNLGNGAAQALLGGNSDEVEERYVQASPRARLPLGVPHTLIHGVHDSIVPVAMSRDYVAAAGTEATLREVADAAHFELIDPQSRAWSTVKDVVLGAVSA